MFARTSRTFKQAFSFAGKFRFSTTSEAPVQKPKGFKRVINFISTNRQQLLNVVAVYFVFSFSVHNLRMQEAWKEQEQQLKKMTDDLERIKANFEEDSWYEAVEQTLQGKKDIKTALKSLVIHRMNQEAKKPEASKDAATNAGGASSDIDELANVLIAEADKPKTSTKMI